MTPTLAFFSLCFDLASHAAGVTPCYRVGVSRIFLRRAGDSRYGVGEHALVDGVAANDGDWHFAVDWLRSRSMVARRHDDGGAA